MDNKTKPQGDETSLSRVDEREFAVDPVAIAAMAEAFRTQAEILQNINRTQREIAQSLEKNERAQGVLTSTRALNDTFKGLTDIQKGLLDALTDGRSRQSGWPIALTALGFIACLVLLFVIKPSGDTVSRVEYARLDSSYRRAAKDLANYRLLDGKRNEEMARSKERARQALKARADSEARARASGGEIELLRAQNKDLTRKAEIRGDEIKNFIIVKDQADRAGLIEIENIDLRRRLRDAEDRFKRLDQERMNMAGLLLTAKMEGRSSAAEVIDAAKRKGLIKDPEPLPGPHTLNLKGAGATTFVRRLNRLFQKASGDKSYELLIVKKLEGGKRLIDVSIGCYRGPRLLNSLHSKALEIWIDEEADQLELRFEDGFYTTVANPREKIPFVGDRHSIFLEDVGLAGWLERFSIHVEVGPDGRLTWKSAPS